MLDEERIKQAQQNVASYLQDGLLKKQDFKEVVFRVLRNNATESLEVAESLVSDFWVIVISYYSMYYIANAVLYKLGYNPSLTF